jgi:hypothetical protein
MFYLIDSNDKLVREHENKASLRKIRRKSPIKDSLRITEGDTLKQSLKNAKDLSKAIEPKETAPKTKVKKSKKAEVTAEAPAKKSKKIRRKK